MYNELLKRKDYVRMKITQKHPYMDVDYTPYKGIDHTPCNTLDDTPCKGYKKGLASPVEMRFIN